MQLTRIPPPEDTCFVHLRVNDPRKRRMYQMLWLDSAMYLEMEYINKVIATYTVERTLLDNVNRIKKLEVKITDDLKWNSNIGNICTKETEIWLLGSSSLHAPGRLRSVVKFIICCSFVDFGVRKWRLKTEADYLKRFQRHSSLKFQTCHYARMSSSCFINIREVAIILVFEPKWEK